MSNTSAQRVIDKCGGVKATAAIVGRTESWVYRWTYPPERGGKNGVVPYDDQVKLLKAARAGLVDLSPEDFFPVEVVAKK